MVVRPGGGRLISGLEGNRRTYGVNGGCSGRAPAVVIAIPSRDPVRCGASRPRRPRPRPGHRGVRAWSRTGRSEEHTSELQSPCNLVCRLLLEKKKKNERERDNQTTVASQAVNH